jgi:FixJ family two-component response regulator
VKPAPGSPIVFLVDDDPLVQRAHARLLRAHGLETATFDSAESFLAQHDASRPGCLVLDINLPGLDGLALQSRLAATCPARPIVFLTGYGDIPTSVQAIKSGAVDFLTKPVAGEVLLAAVRRALVQDAEARRAAAEFSELRRRLASLSRREREVLRRLAAGKLNKQIADELGITEATVKFHRARLMGRMQAHTLAELMHAAARGELISAGVPAPASARRPEPASAAAAPRSVAKRAEDSQGDPGDLTITIAATDFELLMAGRSSLQDLLREGRAKLAGTPTMPETHTVATCDPYSRGGIRV